MGAWELTRSDGKSAPILLLMFINIHHYFTDGVIWKISNPEVRQELFAHVTVPKPPREKGAKRAVAAKGDIKPKEPARVRR